MSTTPLIALTQQVTEAVTAEVGEPGSIVTHYGSVLPVHGKHRDWSVPVDAPSRARLGYAGMRLRASTPGSDSAHRYGVWLRVLDRHGDTLHRIHVQVAAADSLRGARRALIATTRAAARTLGGAMEFGGDVRVEGSEAFLLKTSTHLRLTSEALDVAAGEPATLLVGIESRRVYA